VGRPATTVAVVCDDDVTLRGVVRGFLERAGYQVTAEVGLMPDLLDVVATGHPQVVVLDVALPGMSGLEGIDALRKLSPESRILVFSAFELDANQRAGIDAFVLKPDFDALERTVIRWHEVLTS
jgi:CheY-like chemotaxis protein